MNYTTLSARIQDIVEDSIDDALIATFVEQAEQRIYNTVQLPALRKNVTGTLTASDPYLAIPDDFLYTYSVAAIDADGAYNYLTNVDANFIREAYPNPTTTAAPKYYAIFSDEFFIVGPTPATPQSVELHYGYYPESIVTAGTTWLGDEFDSALLNASLLEAARFTKAEEDVVAMYNRMYTESMALLKNLGTGKLMQDTYRSGETRARPS